MDDDRYPSQELSSIPGRSISSNSGIRRFTTSRGTSVVSESPLAAKSKVGSKWLQRRKVKETQSNRQKLRKNKRASALKRWFEGS